MRVSIAVFLLCLLTSSVTWGEVYRINNTDDLIEFSNKVNSSMSFDGTTVLLENDLSFSEEQLEAFYPIGTYEMLAFNGTFDGQGHTISNFNYNKSLRITGLFGISRGMTVKNIVVDESCLIKTDYNSTAAENFVNIGVIGCCVPIEKPCIVEGVVNMADITYTGSVAGGTGTLSIGGILGDISPYGESSSIKDCANYGTLTHLGLCMYASFGGICGAYFNKEVSTKDRIVMENNFNGGKLVCRGETLSMLVAGGILGTSIKGEIKNCVHYGEVQFYTATAEKGAMVGGYTLDLVISHCYWMNTTYFYEACGFGYQSSATVKDSYSIGPNITVLDSLNSWASENGRTEWVALYTNRGRIREINSEVVFAPKKAFPDPRKEGHSFAGWCTSSDCTNGIYSKGEIEENFANITELHAQWSINNYTVTFILKNGTAIEKTYKFNDTITYPEGKVEWDTLIVHMPARNVTIRPAAGSGDSGSKAGIIAGGVIGGVALIAIVVVAVVYVLIFVKKERGKYDTEMELEREKPLYRFVDDKSTFQPIKGTEDVEVKNMVTNLYPVQYKIPTPAEALIEAGIRREDANMAVKQCEKGILVNNRAGPMIAELEKEDAIAVALYTFDFGPGMFESNPYRIVNRALMNGGREELLNARGLLYVIMSAVRKLPRSEGRTLYRGMRDAIEIDKYTEGEVVTWPGFSSTSPDMKATKAFLSEAEVVTGTLFVIEDGWGYNIQPYSMFPEEEEILLEPGRRFRVQGIIESDVTVIKLQMLDTPLLLPELFGSSGK